MRLTAPHFAYLRIAEGCDHRCSYCVVPSLRGPYRSKATEEILREARELSNGGARELILIAQDTARFGVDLRGRSTTHRLLESLAVLRGVKWIRLLYAHPASITRDLIGTIARLDKVVKYLDVPVQHASDRILRRMRRRTTRADLKRLVERLRKKVPGIALRTTAIVGFPGETARDFNDLLTFIEWARFERLGAFVYSREPGTTAAQMAGQLPAREKKTRLRELMMLQADNSLRYHRSLVGMEVPAIVDSQSGSSDAHSGAHDLFLGRTFADAPEVDCTTTIEGTGLAPGDILSVRVISAATYDLRGVACKI
jgi:ribosomal protein S12 methylthiotransferase